MWHIFFLIVCVSNQASLFACLKDQALTVVSKKRDLQIGTLPVELQAELMDRCGPHILLDRKGSLSAIKEYCMHIDESKKTISLLAAALNRGSYEYIQEAVKWSDIDICSLGMKPIERVFLSPIKKKEKIEIIKSLLKRGATVTPYALVFAYTQNNDKAYRMLSGHDKYQNNMSHFQFLFLTYGFGFAPRQIYKATSFLKSIIPSLKMCWA